MIGRRSHGVIFLLILMSALLALNGCGRKGSPKPPSGEEANYSDPQPYPKPNTVGAVPAGQDPQDTRGPLSIFQGTQKQKPPPPDPNAEPQSILVLPPPEGETNMRRRGTPNVLPDSRTRTRTF